MFCLLQPSKQARISELILAVNHLNAKKKRTWAFAEEYIKIRPVWPSIKKEAVYRVREYILYLALFQRIDRRGGLVVRASASRAAGRGFDPRLRQTKGLKTGSSGFPPWRSGLWE